LEWIFLLPINCPALTPAGTAMSIETHEKKFESDFQIPGNYFLKTNKIF